MSLLLVFYWLFLSFEYCTGNDSYILSNGQLRIISTSNKCNIGRIEINDYLNGWGMITSQCLANIAYTNNAFDTTIGHAICNNLGFGSFVSYQIGISNNPLLQNITKTTDKIAYNYINCDGNMNVANICQECELKLDQNTLCDDKLNIFIECADWNEQNDDLQCIPYDDDYDEYESNNKCYGITSNDDITTYNLAKKPFYEDSTFLLVVIIIGIVIVLCCTVGICSYCQSQYGFCLAFKGCIDLLMCRCMSYEGDDDDYDVSTKNKAELARRQKNQQQNIWWGD